MTTMSLQAQFDYLYRSISANRTEFQTHHDSVSAIGVDATQQKQFGEKVNGFMPTIESSIGITELTAWWRQAKPSAPAYDVIPDLEKLLADLQDFQIIVFTGTPVDADSGHIRDTKMLLDGIEQKDFNEPYDGPCVISYEPRHYTPTQASGAYLPALQACIDIMTTILDS